MAEDTDNKEAQDKAAESDESPKARQDSIGFWKVWIKAAKKAAEDHWDISRKAWDEYEDGDGYDEDEGSSGRPYPIYWSSVKTLAPKYYTRTPIIRAKREFGITDPVAMTGSLIVERLAKTLSKNINFDELMKFTVVDFINSDKAALQVAYSEETGEVEKPLTQVTKGQFVDSRGMAWEDEVFQNPETGAFFGKAIEPKNQRINLMLLPYCEVLHTPKAKCESEISEKAFYFFLTQEEAEARFGKEALKDVKWKSEKSKSDKEQRTVNSEAVETTDKYLEGWECYSKVTKKVYWVSDQVSGKFLDEKPDPYKLRGFFPATSFLISNKPLLSMYPNPVYKRLRHLIGQLHDSQTKISRLIEGIRRRALVDGTDEDLLAALNTVEGGEFIACEALSSLLEKVGGDASKLVWYIPVKELVDAITELSSLQEKFKNEFFEWFGMPDILRGSTNPNETAEAQDIKTGAAHDRFYLDKLGVAGLVREALELVVEMGLKNLPTPIIMELVGYQYMTPEHQGRFVPALEFLKNDLTRLVRLDIDTETMSFSDDRARAQKAQAAGELVTMALEKIAQMMQLDPSAAAVALQAVLMSLDAISPGKEMEDALRASVNALMEKAKNPPPAQPPPPDYEQMKLNILNQKQQTEAFKVSRDLDRKDFEMQLKQAKLEIEAQKTNAATALEEYRLQVDQELQNFLASLERQRVEIEQFKAEMQARESEMEEVRLAREADTNQVTAILETQKTASETEAPQVSPVTVNINHATPEGELLPNMVLNGETNL